MMPEWMQMLAAAFGWRRPFGYGITLPWVFDRREYYWFLEPGLRRALFKAICK